METKGLLAWSFRCPLKVKNNTERFRTQNTRKTSHNHERDCQS